MEHHPYMTLEDETEITISDLKTDNNGEDYITVYFETPTEDGFSSMDIRYPCGKVEHIVGYTETEVKKYLGLIKNIKPYWTIKKLREKWEILRQVVNNEFCTNIDSFEEFQRKFLIYDSLDEMEEKSRLCIEDIREAFDMGVVYSIEGVIIAEEKQLYYWL